MHRADACTLLKVMTLVLRGRNVILLLSKEPLPIMRMHVYIRQYAWGVLMSRPKRLADLITISHGAPIAFVRSRNSKTLRLATRPPKRPRGRASSVISHRYAKRLETRLVNRSTCLHARSECGSFGRLSRATTSHRGPSRCGHSSAPSPFCYAALRAIITPTLQVPHKHEPCPRSMRTSWQVLYRNVKEHHLTLNLHQHPQP
jgi:hypothetical protein